MNVYKVTWWKPGTWATPWRQLSIVVLYLPVVALWAVESAFDGAREAHSELVGAWNRRGGKQRR